MKIMFVGIILALSTSITVQNSLDSLFRPQEAIQAPGLNQHLNKNEICGPGCASCSYDGCQICYRRQNVLGSNGNNYCINKIEPISPVSDYYISTSLNRPPICKAGYSISLKNECKIDNSIEKCYQYAKAGPTVKCVACWGGIPRDGGTWCKKDTSYHMCDALGHINFSGIKCLRCRRLFTLDYNNECQSDQIHFGGEGCYEMKGPYCNVCDTARGWYQDEYLGNCKKA